LYDAGASELSMKKIRERGQVDDHMDSQANLEQDLVNELILVKNSVKIECI